MLLNFFLSYSNDVSPNSIHLHRNRCAHHMHSIQFIHSNCKSILRIIRTLNTLSDIESNESALFLVHSSHIFSHTKISMRTVERKLWHITEDKKIETGQ